MKKVLFVMNSLSTGGAEKVLANIVNHLSLEKFEVTLLTIFGNTSPGNGIRHGIQRKSIVCCKNKYVQGLAYKIFCRLMTPQALYAKLIKEKYDIEIAFLEGLPTKIVSGSNNPQSKKIAWVHTDLLQFRDSDYCFKTEEQQRKSYEAFDEVVSVSHGVKTAFENRLHCNVNKKVIYNPVDEIEVRKKSRLPMKGKAPYQKNVFRFVSVGRLHPQKGYERLIEACNLLRNQGFIFEMCIVGEGTEHSRLQEIIHKYKLEEYVHLYGYSSNPYQIIARANCMIVSSYVEGFSLVTMEALILGVPVIATNVTGSQEILENGKWGLLVDNSLKGIVDGMEKMFVSEVYEKYVMLAQERGSHFCFRETMRSIEKLFEDI